jgi:hypothetical protein
MNSIVILGWKKSPSGPVPVNIYTGLDGVAGIEAHKKALATGEFIAFRRFSNPVGAPMATDSTPTVASGAPKPVEREAHKLPIHTGTEKYPAKAPVKAEAPKAPVKKEESQFQLRTDGPTLEQFVAAGYKAENYPPPGYAAVQSVPAETNTQTDNEKSPEKV